MENTATFNFGANNATPITNKLPTVKKKHFQNPTYVNFVVF